ncbi:hypothetical protein TrRE_jg3660 [Triparma retinervis]|uniref:NAD(P)-binding protein n=1 Tax=Triparma retinervis TaxID=2557542 RepID=A0A9W7DVQ0_9STRA|nr:hypothetical protein TrRE_jg3660 [Triparma retinervis]
MKFISESSVSSILTPSLAIQSQYIAFTTPSTTPSRLHLPSPFGPTLVKPSTLQISGTLRSGTKIVSVRPSQPDTVPATLLMIDCPTGKVTHAISASALTALRTAAGSTVATMSIMSGRTPLRLLIAGSGSQGRQHARCMLSSYPSLHVTLSNRTLSRAESLRRDIIDEFKLGEDRVKATTLEGAEEEVGKADVVCLCTVAEGPVFPSCWYKADVHVNAVGGFNGDMREVDSAFLLSCGSVVLDAEEALEAGDLLQGGSAVSEGVKRKL